MSFNPIGVIITILGFFAVLVGVRGDFSAVTSAIFNVAPSSPTQAAGTAGSTTAGSTGSAGSTIGSNAGSAIGGATSNFGSSVGGALHSFLGGS